MRVLLGSRRGLAVLAGSVGLVLVVAGCSSVSGAPQSVAVTAAPPASGSASSSAAVSAPSSAAGEGTAPSSAPVPSSVLPQSSTAPTTPTTPTAQPPVAAVTASPAAGTTGMSPTTPITVSVTRGTITSLTLTNPTGYQVKGALSSDRASWKSSEVLGYGKTYTLQGTATGTDGKTVPIRGTYAVVDPKTEVRTTIYPTDDMTVGVAMPIMVKFETEPQDRALIEKHVSVTTSPKVDGAWAWIQHDGGTWGLDFRPQGYWPENTEVHVEADMYGLQFGDGAWGKTDLTSDFTIGRNQVVKADVNSYEMIVQRDGVTVATYPASYGRGGDDPDLTTRSGIHVVNDKFTDKRMINPKYHYDVVEKWAVRISNNGEFIHANPKSVASQGSANVTHGCVNLSLEHAQAYYDTAMIGDPVEVTGTDVKLGPSDGDIFDYAIPWSTWLTLSALD